MTLRQQIQQAISEGVGAEETSREITDRVMKVLVQEVSR